MKSHLKRRFIAGILMLSLATALLGCSKREFAKQIIDFQTGVDNTATATSVYYSELNSFERDLYLQERLYDPSQDVLTVTRDPNDPSKNIPTALAGKTFSAESIKARIEAIQMLGLYGKRLAELAGSDASTRFAAGSQSVGNNLVKLGGTFSTLTGDPTAKNYAAPLGALSKIFGEIGKAMLEAKRDAALTKAVQEAAPQVRTIIDLLENDLTTVIGPLRATGSDQALREVIGNYNTNRTKWNLDQRQKALDEIRRAQARYDIAITFNPSDIMESMRVAHEALVKYATSRRTPQNLAELVSSLDIFRERAEVLATAVLELRNLRRGTQ